MKDVTLSSHGQERWGYDDFRVLLIEGSLKSPHYPRITWTTLDFIESEAKDIGELSRD